MSLPVVFEHPDFIIIDKPAGLSVQLEQGQDYSHSLLNRLCQQLALPKLWLVHRLDKLTSGLLILAKNAEAAALLSRLFADKKIQKYYLALSNKKPKKKQGCIMGDMKKVRDGKWILQKTKQNPAISQFFSSGLGNGLRLFIIKPHTGKTHQIRVALKSLGCAIHGDTLYGADKADRAYLHAFALSFHYRQQHIYIQQAPQQGELFKLAPCVTALDVYDPPTALAWPSIKAVPDNC